MATTMVQPATHNKLRFKLKQNSGKHYHGVGHARKCYMAGDVIEVDHIGQLGSSLNKWEPAEGTMSIEDALAANEQKNNTPALQSLKPIHRSGGKWFVLNTETEEFTNDAPLTKAQAFELAGLPLP